MGQRYDDKKEDRSPGISAVTEITVNGINLIMDLQKMKNRINVKTTPDRRKKINTKRKKETNTPPSSGRQMNILKKRRHQEVI